MTTIRPLTLLSAAGFFAVAHVHAAYPLIVDDADILDVGESEFVVSYDFLLDDHEIGYAFPLQFTHGIMPRVEFAIDGGYQFLQERGHGHAHAHLEHDNHEDEHDGPERHRVDGWLDTILALKWKALDQGRSPFAVTLEGSIKLPTASSRRGLGTGNIDFGLNLAATRDFGGTALDLNVGYLFAEHFHGRRRDSDEWFYGAAVRHGATETVELFAEIFGETPAAGRSGTIVTTRAGLTWEFREGFALAGAAGTAFGRDSEDLLATVGLIRMF